MLNNITTEPKYDALVSKAVRTILIICVDENSFFFVLLHKVSNVTVDFCHHSSAVFCCVKASCSCDSATTAYLRLVLVINV